MKSFRQRTACTRAWHTGDLGGGCYLGVKRSRSEARLGLIVPGPLVPGHQPASLMAFLSAKEPSGPLPHLCPTSQSYKPLPSSPTGWLSQTALPSSAELGLRTCSSLPQRPSWACHPPPATRPRGPPSAPAGFSFGRLWALRPLCSLITQQPVGSRARARDLLWFLGGV